MARVALLCGEAGKGLGHAVALSQIGLALRAAGWRPVLALPSDLAPAALHIRDMLVGSVPRWGEDVPGFTPERTSSASMGDSLAELGLQSVGCVERQIERWRNLFAEHDPDLIVADYAPGAVLAARDRIPCVAVGVGFAVPPADLRHFPPLHNFAPVCHDESATCATVNTVLARFGSRPIDHLPEALTGDAQCVRTLPLLDAYRSFRTTPVSGPLLREPIIPRGENAVEVFCYLRNGPGFERLDEISVCLEGLPGRVVAYLPGLSEARKAALRQAGVEVTDGPPSPAAQLARSRLFVGYGGHGMAAAALLAGVPQIILSTDIEKYLIANALTERGVAQHFDYRFAEPDKVRIAIEAALDDPAMLMEAERTSREHAEYRVRDVAAKIAAFCGRMLV
jgi:hypothetical protein